MYVSLYSVAENIHFKEENLLLLYFLESAMVIYFACFLCDFDTDVGF